ncbi:MAG: hypothetical protein D6746_02565 [Bacteroidetes bacterium]|nr:MAG: hypothetical protein D6746_02565 [Bacteroidota bacterium]
MTLIDIKTFSAAAAYAWHLCPVESHVGYESAQMLFKEVAGFWPEYNREGIREAFERYDKIMVVGCRLNYRFSDPKYKAVVGRQTPTLSDYEFFVVKKL